VPGLQHKDAFVRNPDGRLGTIANWSSGVQGGISNGGDIYFRVGFKSPAIISTSQKTAVDGTPGQLAARGRQLEDKCTAGKNKWFFTALRF